MSHYVYLLLGSNLGEREKQLQLAESMLIDKVGHFVSASAVYETAAWGVTDQPTFLNKVLTLSTSLAAEEILQATQLIEKEVGMAKAYKWGPRILDIDILLLDQVTISTPQLKVPHPEIPNRRFTLVPLAEVAGKLNHPTLNKTINQLLEECPDKLPVSKYKPQPGFYIAIEGNIGIGKTTLARKLANHYDVGLVLEEFENNPYLEDFYASNKGVHLPLELFFLNHRYKQLQTNQGGANTIADFALVKSMLFAEVNLKGAEYGLFKDIFDLYHAQLPKPALTIYLKSGIDQLQYQIKQRGRPYEQSIKDEYLLKIDAAYTSYFNRYENQLVSIDLSTLNLLNNPEHFQQLTETIEARVLAIR